MEAKRKKLWILASFSILLILVFMILAVIQCKKELATLQAQEQFEFYFNENWTMFSLDSSKMQEAEQKNCHQLYKQIKDGEKTQNCQEINLPYIEKNNSINKNAIIVFKNILSEEYSNLSLTISSENAMIHIFINNELIYEYGSINQINTEEKIPEKKEHLIVLPTIFQEEEIWITLSSLYPDKDAKITLNSVKINQQSTIIGIFGNSIADINCCLLMIIMAIILFMLALIRKYTLQQARGERAIFKPLCNRCWNLSFYWNRYLKYVLQSA